MEGLIYLLIAILLSACYDIMMNTTTDKRTEKSIVPVQESLRIAEHKTASIIKERLLQIYHSEIDDKREKITRLLVQLERVEDPDVFFDENDHIRSYIFNMNS